MIEKDIVKANLLLFINATRDGHIVSEMNDKLVEALDALILARIEQAMEPVYRQIQILGNRQY